MTQTAIIDKLTDMAATEDAREQMEDLVAELIEQVEKDQARDMAIDLREFGQDEAAGVIEANYITN